MNDKYVCYFVVYLRTIPLLRGAMGFGGNYSREQLRTDNDLLQGVLDSIRDTIVNTLKVPRDIDGLKIMMFLPDLID